MKTLLTALSEQEEFPEVQGGMSLYVVILLAARQEPVPMNIDFRNTYFEEPRRYYP